jgi:hypothetical protein
MPVVISNIPYLDEPLPTPGISLPATEHAGYSNLYIR